MATPDHNSTIVIGQYRVEVVSVHLSGVHDNYWAQVRGPGGILARFGKPVPAVQQAAVARDAAIFQAVEWVTQHTKVVATQA